MYNNDIIIELPHKLNLPIADDGRNAPKTVFRVLNVILITTMAAVAVSSNVIFIEWAVKKKSYYDSAECADTLFHCFCIQLYIYYYRSTSSTDDDVKLTARTIFYNNCRKAHFLARNLNAFVDLALIIIQIIFQILICHKLK